MCIILQHLMYLGQITLSKEMDQSVHFKFFHWNNLSFIDFKKFYITHKLKLFFYGNNQLKKIKNMYI